jgi:lysyl-tRNA synthetase class 2
VHGISDPEIGRRYRYVDLIAAGLKVDLGKDESKDESTNENAATSRELSSREVFERRSRLITEMRRYLDAHGYIEVETPMLSPIASGAAAKPFKTHHNALDIDLYARIAPELYLKRLLVGGFERVYELNRNFRNEGIGYRWNPEFTMLEFYCAYMDVNGMMDFCEEMIRTTVDKATGETRFCFGDEIDFGRKFERLTMKEAIGRFWDSNLRELGNDTFTTAWLDDSQKIQQLIFFLRALDDEITSVQNAQQDFFSAASVQERLNTIYEIVVRKSKDEIWQRVSTQIEPISDDEEDSVIARGIETLFGYFEHLLLQPTFITNFPKPISPLSKASPSDPSIAERFELYVAGMEIANGFSELNDPVEQYERFEEQARQRERGDEEAMQMDVDYVRALAYGMPPAAGIGIGIDRLVMLLTNRRSIRDVILFPHMKPINQFAALKWIFNELRATPDWEQLDTESKAAKFVARFNDWVSDPESPPSRKLLLGNTAKEQLRTAKRAIRMFEEEDEENEQS